MTCFIYLNVNGQKGITADQGAFSTGLGGISSVIGSSDAILNNFSLITKESSYGVILSSSRRFNLEELSSVSAGFHVPVGRLSHFGLSLYHFGFSSYSEQQMSLKYARMLSSKLSISAAFGYQNLQVEENGSAGKLTFELGMSGNINESLIWGLKLTNPEKISFNETTNLVTQLAFGLNYLVSSKVALYGELDKQLEEDISFKAGIDYKLHDILSLRVGYNTSPGQISLGVDYQLVKSIAMQLAFNYDTLLGITPVLTINYMPSQKDN